MKRSFQVSAPLLAAAALALTTGCRRPQMQRCVDEHNNVVPDANCQNTQQQSRGAYGNVPIYRYYYGGTGTYGIGSPAVGGGYIPSSGASYSTSTSRGGFGSSSGGDSGGGHGGGGGEGGGS